MQLAKVRGPFGILTRTLCQGISRVGLRDCGCGLGVLHFQIYDIPFRKCYMFLGRVQVIYRECQIRRIIWEMFESYYQSEQLLISSLAQLLSIITLPLHLIPNIQMSELSNYNHKSHILQQQWKLHSVSYHQLTNALRHFHNIQSTRMQHLKTVLGQLDGVTSIFYRNIAGRLASYLDTTLFQTNHMLEDLKDMLTNYESRFGQVERTWVELVGEFRRRKQETQDGLAQINRSLGKGAAVAKGMVEGYNYALQKYNEANKNILKFRKDNHQQLIALATDELTRFFVLELERLRNNQFDIDQILKKDVKQELPKLIPLHEEIMWRRIEAGEVDHQPQQQHDLAKLDNIVQNLFKQKLQPSHPLLTLFKQQLLDSALGKLPELLSSIQFESLLRKFFMHFRDQTSYLTLSQKSFKRVLSLATTILQQSSQHLHYETLDALMLFSAAIRTRRGIANEREFTLYEVMSLEEELRKHDYMKDEYWVAVGDNILATQEGQQREESMEKYRKCMRKLGISMGEQVKPKKRIFGKLGGNGNTGNSSNLKPE